MSGAEQSQPSEIGIAEAADRMAALMGVIDGSFDDEGHVPPPEAFRNTV